MKKPLLPILLLALLSSGCGESPEPGKTAAPPPAVVAPRAAPAAKPVPKPVSTVKIPPLKVDEVVPAPSQASVKPPATSSSKAPAKTKAPAQAKLEVPKLELDLHLHEEMLEPIELGEPLPPTQLLPSLFGNKAQSDFRLNGRLINSEEEDKLFDGAELSFEFRR